MDQFGMGASDAGPGVTYRLGELMAPGGDDERGSEVADTVVTAVALLFALGAPRKAMFRLGALRLKPAAVRPSSTR
jgi:hypothetical protein